MNSPMHTHSASSANASGADRPSPNHSSSTLSAAGTSDTSTFTSAFAPNSSRGGTGASFKIHSVRPSRLMETHAVFTVACIRQTTAASMGATACAPPICATSSAACPRTNSTYTEKPSSITAPIPVFSK